MEIDLTNDELPTIERVKQCEWEGWYGDDPRCPNNCRQGYYCRTHARELLHLQVAPSQIPEAGLGLYTLSDRKQWKMVDEYIGDIITEAQFEEAPNAFGIALGRGRILTSYVSTDCFARYACDADGPSRLPGVENNCVLMTDAQFGREHATPRYRGRGDMIFLVTTREIAAGEELFCDYSGNRATDTYWSARGGGVSDSEVSSSEESDSDNEDSDSDSDSGSSGSSDSDDDVMKSCPCGRSKRPGGGECYFCRNG